MADFENIKHAVEAAEECAVWASNAAEAMASIVPDGEPTPHWVSFHQRQIEQLTAAIDAIVFALNRARV